MPRTLRIYAVADIHSPDTFRMPELSADQFDLVLTLGDIEPDTLDYVWCMAKNIPAFGVLGNHDPKEIAGLDNLHGRVIEVRGLKIAGFGGAPKYKDLPNHYTEREVAKKMKRMKPADIFISHAPPLATSQGEDRVHKGFAAFDDYLKTYKPRYWLHGHLSKWYRQRVEATEVIGVAEGKPLTLEFS